MDGARLVMRRNLNPRWMDDARRVNKRFLNPRCLSYLVSHDGRALPMRPNKHSEDEWPSQGRGGGESVRVQIRGLHSSTSQLNVSRFCFCNPEITQRISQKVQRERPCLLGGGRRLGGHLLGVLRLPLALLDLTAHRIRERNRLVNQWEERDKTCRLVGRLRQQPMRRKGQD